MSGFTVRSANRADARAIAEIYNHYIAHSTATFDTELKTTEEREAWLDDHGDRYPVVVAERDGSVVGFGSLTKFRERAAWAGTVEAGVYVAAHATGGGTGPALLERLLAEARECGFHVVVAQIVADNEASLKMVERAGFERVGTLREVGYKFHRWLDVVLVERVL